MTTLPSIESRRCLLLLLWSLLLQEGQISEFQEHHPKIHKKTKA